MLLVATLIKSDLYYFLVMDALPVRHLEAVYKSPLYLQPAYIITTGIGSRQNCELPVITKVTLSFFQGYVVSK
jgi:hypothetical protein